MNKGTLTLAASILVAVGLAATIWWWAWLVVGSINDALAGSPQGDAWYAIWGISLFPLVVLTFGLSGAATALGIRIVYEMAD